MSQANPANRTTSSSPHLYTGHWSVFRLRAVSYVSLQKVTARET